MAHYTGGGYQAVPPASPAGPRPYNSPPLPSRNDGQQQLEQQYHRQQYQHQQLLQHATPPPPQGHPQAYPLHPAHAPAALYPNYDGAVQGAPEYSSIPLQAMPSAAPHAMTPPGPPPSSAHLPHATSSPSFSTFASDHSGGQYFAAPPSPPSASQPPGQSQFPPPAAFQTPVYGGSRVQRRKTMRNIQLTKGHLVVDAPVPDGVLQNAGIKTGEEFTHLRYTAATCDPNDFAAQNYTLRPAMYGRHTELFVVMTMYNEDDELFCKTMSAVTKNIAHLCTRTKSRTWGENGWQKAVVCIVADGRKKIHPRVLTCLAAMGVFQDGIAKNTVNGKEVTAHIYEYTTQVVIDQDLTIRGQDRGTVPVQIVFCLKEQNKKKLNSHRWFFNAFGRVVNPNVCVLLDVGTRPTGTSIYHLWKAFDRDPLVAGACGEIAADLGRGWSNLLNPLVATQNFEYKMSNILDKPLESMFGYISVLPGAFSAYRYTALQDTSPGVGPLSQYFKGETMHGAGAGVFEANMYLAEDRILCFELVAKKHCSWLLKYVKSAKAETDVPDNVAEFVSQRRRWLNGSFFAAAYALWKWNQIWATDHSLTRKILLQVEFVYNTISMIFSWFALANFYLTFYFLTRPGTGESPFGSMNASYIGEILREVYLFAIIVMFICALGNRPQGSKFIYALVIFLFGVIMVVMLYIAGWTVVGQVAAVRERLQSSGGNFSFSRLSGELSSNPAFRDIVISLASTYGLYFVSSLLHLDPWHMFTSFPQYIIMLPAFVNILMVYAFCNTHDVSWGTKGDNAPKADLGAAVMTTNKDGVQTVEVELPTEKEDINEAYDRTLRELAVRPEVKKQSRDASTKQEDYYRFFRTRLVLVWIFSNALLVILMTLLFDKGESTSIRAPTGFTYLTIIFWSVAALSAARFFGSTAYLVNRVIFG